MTSRCFLSSARLMCRAAANSRKPSIPCINVLLKSMPARWVRALASTDGKISPRATRASEVPIAISMSPIVVGSRSSRWFR